MRNVTFSSPEVKRKLAGLADTMADCKYVLGRKLAELGPGAPTLEAATAACALAQGELGHARVLYKLAADLRGVAAESWQEESFQPEGKDAFPFLQEEGIRWVELIAALYVTDTAIDVLLEGLLSSNPSVLISLHKLVEEQNNQIQYAEGWLSALAHDSGLIPGIAADTLSRMVPQAETWLVAIEADGVLTDAGLEATDGESMTQIFRKRVTALVAESGLPVSK